MCVVGTRRGLRQPSIRLLFSLISYSQNLYFSTSSSSSFSPSPSQRINILLRFDVFTNRLSYRISFRVRPDRIEILIHAGHHLLESHLVIICAPTCSPRLDTNLKEKLEPSNICAVEPQYGSLLCARLCVRNDICVHLT